MADSVDFETTLGVEGVSATAIGTVDGGALDGQRASYELLYEEGSYQVNTVFAAPEAG